VKADFAQMIVITVHPVYPASIGELALLDNERSKSEIDAD
jgi:hypothetical protein